MSLRLLIAGGGTGGHLFPGVAVADTFLEFHSTGEVLFVGTKRGIESRVLPGLGWKLKDIQVSGVKTMGAWAALSGILRIPRGIWQSRRIIDEFKPDVVIGVGGYASGPVVLAAWLMGIPTAILEQNSIPGITNRILGKIANRIFLSFSSSQRFFSKKKSVLVGNPIRKEITPLLGEAQYSSSDTVRFFVVGGSQGAAGVNQMCCQAFSILVSEGISVQIVHQTGAALLESTRRCYAAAGVAAECRSFIADMAAEYRAADVVICRAGATTIAELSVVGIPAIFIPYPYAANNHQELNAQEMVTAGAALLLKEQEGAGVVLADMTRNLCRDGEVRMRMSRKMQGFGRPEAAREIVTWISSKKRRS